MKQHASKVRYISFALLLAAFLAWLTRFFLEATMAMAHWPSQSVVTVCLTGPPACDYNDIQEAVDAVAAAGGGRVEVAPGTYPGGISLKSSVVVSGSGYTQTILDGEKNGRVVEAFGADITETAGLQGCRIVNGLAVTGAGLAIDQGARPLIRNNWFEGNRATLGGGALYAGRYSGGTVVWNVIFSNMADSNGSGMWLNGSSINLHNNVVVSNSGGGGQHGIRLRNVAFARVYNNIVVSNGIGLSVGPGSLAIIHHNDIWHNDQDYEGVSPGEGSLSVDPRFVDLADHDFHLRGDSPLIDAGDPATPASFDMDGWPVPDDGDFDSVARADIGAYEFHPGSSSLPWDFDGDGEVTVIDLNMIANHWNTHLGDENFREKYDLDNDDDTDIRDVQIVAYHWG